MQNPQYQEPLPTKKAGLSTPLIILLVVLGSCGLCGLIGGIGSLFQKDKPASIAQTNANAATTPPESRPIAEKTIKSTPTAKSSGVTLENFNKIQTGMTYAQVVGILGEEGTVISENEIGDYKTVMYQFTGGFGSNCNTMFQNGKLISKAQFGLR
jgi:cytoskeletal protein RodZ